MLTAYAERMRPYFEKFAWPAESNPSTVPIDDAIAAMRKIADSMPHGSVEKDRARARAIGAEADKWRSKMNGDQKALKRMDVFVRSYL
jgi:hypothetical protein